MFQRVGIVEGRVPLPLPLAFHYLIVIIRRFKLGHENFTGSKMTSPYSWNARFSAIVLPCPFYGSKILGPSKTFWWCTNCCGQVNQENRVPYFQSHTVSAETILFRIWKLQKIQLFVANFNSLINELNFCCGNYSREKNQFRAETMRGNTVIILSFSVRTELKNNICRKADIR